jgi:hypothetical protein
MILTTRYKKTFMKVANEGPKIYESIKSRYDPKEKGKYLAIEVDSKDVYLAKTTLKAVEKAQKDHPKKIFYIVKIGYDSIETMARSILGED